MIWLEQLKNASLIEPLGWTILHSLWQGIAIAIIAAVLLRLTRSRSAQLRYVIACLALFSMLIAAIVTFAELRPPKASPTVIETAPIRLVAPTVQPIQASEPIETIRPVTPTLSDRIRPILPSLALAWIAGVILLGAYHAGGWMLLRRLRFQSRTIADVFSRAMLTDLIAAMHIHRTVQLCESVLVQVPTVIGWLSPIILFPASAMVGLSHPELRGLLAHELAHIRRHDYLVNLLQTVIETLLFYHPTTWWLGKVIRQERENCCDDLAATFCDRTIYAQALATMESLRQSPQLALSAKGAALLPRIRRILGLPTAPNRRSLSSGIVSASILVAVIAGGILLNACRSNANAPTTKPVQPTTRADIAYTDPTEADVKAPPEQDYRIVPGDLLNIVINAPYRSQKWTGTVRVKDNGTVDLQEAGLFKAQGLTEKELARQIENGRRGVAAAVTVNERRGRNFSIRGCVAQPGQYEIPKADLRLNDVIEMARGINEPVTNIYVIRNQSSAAGGQRTIGIPLDKLRTDPEHFNIVIYPNDLVQVMPAGPAIQPDEPRNVVSIHSNDMNFEVTSRQINTSIPTEADLKPSTRPASETGTYTISGMVERPGLLTTSPGDFRLLDAIAQAQGTTPSAKSVAICRGDSEKMRIIFVSLDQLHSHPEAFNVTILPKDSIYIGPPMGPISAHASTQRIDSSRITLQGRITEAATGKPVPNVKVEILGGITEVNEGILGRELFETDTTDADGRYHLDRSIRDFTSSKSATRSGDQNIYLQIRIDNPTLCSADGRSWWDVTIPQGTPIFTKDFKLTAGIPIDQRERRAIYQRALMQLAEHREQLAAMQAKSSPDDAALLLLQRQIDQDKAVAARFSNYFPDAQIGVTTQPTSQRTGYLPKPDVTSTPSTSEDSVEEMQRKLNLARSRIQATQLKLRNLEAQSGQPASNDSHEHLEDELSRYTNDVNQLQIAIALAQHEVPPSPTAATAPTTQSSLTDSLQQMSQENLKQLFKKLDEQYVTEAGQLSEAERQYGEHNPAVTTAKQRVDTIAKQEQIVAAALNAAAANSATQPAVRETGEYYISGLSQSGVYSLNGGQITILQALIKAGMEDWTPDEDLTIVHRDGSRREYKISDVVNRGDGQTAVQPGDVLMFASNLPQGEYYVGGEVPRVGVYSLSMRQINVLQALISAGVDPLQSTDDTVEVRHRLSDGKDQIETRSVKELLDTPAAEIVLKPDDQVLVKKPSTQPTTKS